MRAASSRSGTGGVSIVSGRARRGAEASWMLGFVRDHYDVNPQPKPTGPLFFTTARGLDRYPPIIWDPNRYYARLGVSTRASKAEIRKAFQRLKGHDDPTMTWAARVLLSDAMRRNYDGLRLGEVFPDEESAALVRVVEALNRAVNLFKATDEERAAYVAEAETRMREVAKLRAEGKNDQPGSRWGWGYFTLRSDCCDLDLLEAWQEHLLEALVEVDCHSPVVLLGVGFVRHGDPWEVHKMNGHHVIFIDATLRPTRALARSAIESIL